MTAEDIRIILAEVAAGRGGPPCRIRSDNGPEFAAEVVRSWLEETGSGALSWRRRARGRTDMRSRFTASSATSSWTARSSRANRRPRALGALWKGEYNTERPHSSLDYKTTAEFAATCVRYVPIDEDLPDPSSTELTNR